MAFTEVSDSIPVQPGINAYNFRSSGSILKGQGVTAVVGPSPGNYVMAISHSSQRLYGVAAYSVDHDEPVAIYGPYNMVRAKLSGAVTAGSLVGPVDDGMLGTYSATIAGIVIEGTSSTGDGVVLLI